MGVSTENERDSCMFCRKMSIERLVIFQIVLVVYYSITE